MSKKEETKSEVDNCAEFCWWWSVLPKVVLAGVASFLIQKETQERTTVRMQGM